MAYISGTITDDAKIIVLDSNHNKIISKDFIPDNYTKLLLHFDESVLVDSSTSAKPLTLNGGVVRNSEQSKFGSYSGYFDGVDDYISTPNSADFTFGNGDFTIDVWSYPMSGYTGANEIITKCAVSSYSPFVIYGDDTKWHFLSSYTGSTWDINIEIGNVVMNTWQHLAVTRSGSTIYVFRNGVLQNTFNIGNNSVWNNTELVMVGRAYYSSPLYYKGYLDELRISKGIARWTTNFTPPAQAYKNPAPFVYNLNGLDRYSYTINNISTLSGTVIAVSNEGEVVGYHNMNYVSDIDSYTKLLLHFDESPLVDTMDKTLTLNGSIARSSSQSKFGSYSGYFNGTSQYITIADSTDWDFSSGDFTIEFWFYTGSIQNGTTLFARRTGEGIGPFYLGINDGTGFPSPYLYFYSSSNGSSWDVASNAGGGPYTTNSWRHIAIVRYGNTLTFYNNGTSVNSFNVTGKSFDGSQKFSLGALDNGSYKFTGYMDEFRISKGIARWTSNFAPPTAAYL